MIGKEDSIRTMALGRVILLAALSCLLLMPSAQSQTYVEKVLYTFGTNSEDGVNPQSALILDSAGNLYGSTSNGGLHQAGIVFKIDPQGNETILYNFTGGTDGGNPNGPLLWSAGKIYGTTATGGARGNGTLFEISAHKERVLYSFQGGIDGTTPLGGIVRDAAGNFYGTTLSGGTANGGTLFKVGADGTETILHNFTLASGDGFQPRGGVIRDAAGNLYGITVLGGSQGWGILFRASTSGTETVLYSFPGFQTPSPVIRDSAGNFYGTASGGSSPEGSVFQINTQREEIVLHTFGKTGDGEYPYAGVIRDAAGNLYGTTYQGGAFGFGAVYQIDATGKETLLYSFTGGTTDGSNPIGGLVEDTKGNLYGTTNYGGPLGAGAVWQKDRRHLDSLKRCI